METHADEFAIQAREHLAVLEQDLLSLEKSTEPAESRERIDRCLRLAHSLKGDAGFLGYTAIRTLANAMESVLETVRDAESLVPAATIERLLAARDRLATLVDDLENSHGADLRDVLAQLEPGERTTHREPEQWDIDLRQLDRERSAHLAEFFSTFERSGVVISPCLTMAEDDLTRELPREPLRFQARLSSSIPADQIRRDLGLPTAAVRLAARGPVVQPTSSGIADRSAALPPAAARPNSASSAVASPAPAPVTRVVMPEQERTASLRISVDLLDRLMTLTGELTLIRNQYLLATDPDDGRFRPIVQRLSAVTSALQETVLQTRMQPVANLFGKFPRVVRDLGRQLGKQVEVTVIGREVELDKTIIEQLSDPLTHLVRNSVDHGIESPRERVAKGKPPTGQITLTAAHEDGLVRIEIRDDGRGIDPQDLRARALAMRFRTETDLDQMTPRELLNLILLPGFSTAGEVTEVSGRGVGMDVVKTNIELLEGSLTIESHFGVGTAMILLMPLTLAIIPCLIVIVNGERYAVPQREVEEAVCLHPRLSGRIEQAFDTEVYRLRDRLLPIVRLREVFNNPRPFTAETKAEIVRKYAASNREPVVTEYIMVVRRGARRFGLLVDEVRGTEEIIVKPMNVAMKRVAVFTGATIMGDGRVALIANVAGIIEHARVNFETELPASPAAVDDAVPVHRFLLFEYGPMERFALPLLEIRRLESLDPGRIEHVGDHEYVTVSRMATRILRLDRILEVSACDPRTATHFALLKHTRTPIGILISRIVDSESLAVELQPASENEPGILGTAVVRDRLTLFLDANQLVEKLLGPAHSAGGAAAASRQSRVLLAADGRGQA